MKKILSILLISSFLFSCNKKESVVAGTWDLKIQINIDRNYVTPINWINCPDGYPDNPYPMWWRYDTTLYADYVTLITVIIPKINSKFYSDTIHADTTIVDVSDPELDTTNMSFTYKITTSYKVVSKSLLN